MSNSTQVAFDVNSENPLTPVPCTTQLVPTPQTDGASAQWNDLITRKGQIFHNANELRRALFEYILPISSRTSS